MNNDIGARIMVLRKNKNMTQEALANMLGISPQAVSKWETGTTLPDILLLPIIAEALDTDINALFGIDNAGCVNDNEKRHKNLTKQNIHEEIYNEFFEILQDLFRNKNETKETIDFIKTHRNAQTMVLSNQEGNGVYADADIALVFTKDKNDIHELLENDAAVAVLKCFAESETKNVFKFIVENESKSFTSSLIAQKCNIDIKSVEKALENLLRLSLVGRTDINADDEIIYAYRAWGTHKKVLIYSMLSIAARLGEYSECYMGFIG